MMGQLRDWLMAVITVSVVIAGAKSLMPPGGVRQVGQLVCGLVLLCVLLRPLCAVEGTSVSRFLEEYAHELQTRETELEHQVESGRRSVMEQFCGTYIEEQAAQLGLECRAEVDCVLNADGLWIPQSARLWGEFDDVTRSRLTGLLETELGILPAAQTYYLT